MRFHLLSIGIKLSQKAYLTSAYGWHAVRQGLHVVRDRPLLLVSNGDQLGEPIRFAVGTGGVVITFTLFFISIEIIARLTALLGRKIHIFAIATKLTSDSKHVAYVLILPAFLCFALIFLLMEVITAGSLPSTICKYAAFLVVASFSLRLVFWNAPEELLRYKPHKPRILRAPRTPSKNSS